MDIHIFTGHLGSGKTEVAVNLALQIAERDQSSTNPPAVGVVDIDVVNPYFAAREARSLLESRGVQVAAPSIQTTTADLPVLSSEIYQMLHRGKDALIIDVGGDPAGARILCSLLDHLQESPLHVYCVVNTKRPSTSSSQGIVEYIQSIQAASRLSMTGLIHNTHLLHETSLEDICAGQQVLEDVSHTTGLPVVFTAAMTRLARDVEGCIANEVLPMEQYIKPPYVL